MNDEEIINLYWSRQENAILETDKKYGKYCNTIILQNIEEAIFEYNGYKFYISTHQVAEDDFINIIKSILN